MMNKPTSTYESYEVVVVPFPFTDAATSKKRPALILSSAKIFNARLGKSIMAMITSLKAEKDLWANDVVIKDLKPTNLVFPSIVRFKLFTLDHSIILRRVGFLGNEDREAVRIKLKAVLAI
jgi:mRNA interferase MazF